METQIKKTNDKQVELTHEKQPYDTPSLKKSGTVRDLTLGNFPMGPDVSGMGGGS